MQNSTKDPKYNCEYKIFSHIIYTPTCPATQASNNDNPFHLNLILEEGKINGNKQIYHMKY